jgi:pyruvate,water dikinase
MRYGKQAKATAGGDPTGSAERARYVVDLREADGTQVALVGGKGAQLGELSRLEGVDVPPGFCVTTDAFRDALGQAPALGDPLGRLSRLGSGDREALGALSAQVREAVAAIAIPEDVAAAIIHALAPLGEDAAYAVRSSATDEDAPAASFAGQHDTFLNCIGADAILEHVRLAWASLFTERAVAYRVRNGVDQGQVQMAVVVQRMVVPEVAGVLFTADPVTSNRTVSSVEATFGLGEALVSGVVSPDTYKVRDGAVVARAIATKRLALHAAPAGGTRKQAVDAQRQTQPALTDAQVVALAQLGRRIEAHFGRPQDIEWCLAGDRVAIVQSRPITTLFPVPAAGDEERHVYVSVGHQQMMTDAMRPLGLSLFALTARPSMHAAGSRLFVDITARLASPRHRVALLEALGTSDPLIGDALRTILERGDVVTPIADDDHDGDAGRAADPPAPIATDPAIVAELIEAREASNAAVERTLRTLSGPALLDFILADVQELKRILFDLRSHQVLMGAMEGVGVAQRAAGGVAGREERGGHADAVGLGQRHVGDGAGAAGRRGRDPPASGRRGGAATQRGRRRPRGAGRGRGRAGGAGGDRRLPGPVRHALRR